MANPAPKPQLHTVAAVAFGGVVGALARVYLPWPGLSYPANPADPLPTLIVNLIGAVLLGFVAGYATHRHWPDALYKGLTVGLLGSFTTMSALALVISLSVTGQPVFEVAVSQTGLGLGALYTLGLFGYVAITTLLTALSYRLGVHQAGA